jgi:hypothetical protein
MTIYIWDPVGGYSKGTAKHISTQGFKPTNHPLTVSTQGYIIPEFADIHLTLGGAADVVIPITFTGQGVIYVDGATAPVVVSLDGTTTFEYDPFGTIDIGGHALFVIDADGNVVHDYSSTGTELDGGPILSGDTAVEYVPGTGLVPERGGRGVVSVGLLKRKTKIVVPNIYIWHAPLLRKFAKYLSGSAEVEFVKNDPFDFIRSLNTLPIIHEPESPTLLRAINNYIKYSPTLFQNDSSAASISVAGKADCSFIQSPIVAQIHDNDAEVLLIALDESPIVTVTQDESYNTIRKDDEIILHLV